MNYLVKKCVRVKESTLYSLSTLSKFRDLSKKHYKYSILSLTLTNITIMKTHGIKSFLNRKSVNYDSALAKFSHKENFVKRNNYNITNYINDNWEKFASFIDKGIKSGEIQGKPVKINTYFDEQKQKRKEYDEVFPTLSIEEKFIIKKDFNDGNLCRFITKNNLIKPKKDYTYTNKTIQCITIILLLRENSLINECYNYLKSIE